MRPYINLISRLLVFGILIFIPVNLCSAQELNVATGADLVSRYNWRGLDFGDAFSLQPYLRLEYGGLKVGFWGSYSTEYEEVDTWTSYTLSLRNAGNVTAIVTDLYYPHAGIRFFNFNNYDDPKGPGAHTVELGLSYTAPERFPIVISGYINVYNDAGNNAYFQLDYPFRVKDADLGIFLGATSGSTKNPSVYLSDNVEIINVGLKATRKLQINSNLEIPVSATYILNPQQEVSYLIFGLSI